MKKTVEESRLHSNLLRTTVYLFDALRDEDYESAKPEMEELQFGMNKLEELAVKRERREKLTAVVKELKIKGVDIDFASRATFLSSSAKNAVKQERKLS
ncbi:hypothetical protein [Cytobacillus gottheilii]|uniref:hypothetical protein n=1 Tax=Cytobacillus gottheilii TaxID=859144 RepID=UPI002494F392|nr:hypothetical protein [Cytobacillus gottheilii]